MANIELLDDNSLNVTISESKNVEAKFIDQDSIYTSTNNGWYEKKYTEIDPVFSASAASLITTTDITSWNNKSSFSGYYNDLPDKPSINNIELSENKTINELGLQPAGDYADKRITNLEIDTLFR